MIKQKSKLKQKGFWSCSDNDDSFPLSAQCNMLTMTKLYFFLIFSICISFVQHIICLVLSNAWLTINISVYHDRSLWIVVYSALSLRSTISQQTVPVQSYKSSLTRKKLINDGLWINLLGLRYQNGNASNLWTDGGAGWLNKEIGFIFWLYWWGNKT